MSGTSPPGPTRPPTPIDLAMSYTRAICFVFLPLLTAATVVLSGSSSTLDAAAREASASAPAAVATARLAGVMVNPEVGPEGEYGPTLAFQNSMNQTALSICVAAPKGGLIGFMPEDSAAETFADSTGKVLYDPEGMFGAFGMGGRIIGDGAAIIVELEGEKAPAANATMVHAKGTIAVRQAFTKGTFDSRSVTFQKGTNLNVGPYSLEVLGAEKASWGDGWDIEFKTKDDVDAIISWTITTQDGERIELDRVSTMTFMGTCQLTARAPKKVESGVLELVAWKDARVIEVPFDVKARVGQE